MVIKTIYIKLLNEGTDSWRPTSGEKIGENLYKVLSIDNYNPEIEEWEFIPGTIVKCELQKKSDRGEPEEIIVAIEKYIGSI
jgi:hypothetical protein